MLKATVVCVGRLKPGPERELTDRYMARATTVGRTLGLTFQTHELIESRARRAPDRMAEEALAIRAQAERGGASCPTVLFDERGRPCTSAGFAEIVRGARDAGMSDLWLVIGGADGLDPSLREGADEILALGAMTWPHQIVRLLIAEQLYRAMTILAGHPYHRA